MIAVIADDLSGATELAGIGWRRGLDAHVGRDFEITPGAELMVLDTDSRAIPPREAAARVEKAALLLARLKPRLIYKKVDSVLRGNVLEEVEALKNTLGRHRALLVPCNPGRGRTIEQGHYFVRGQQIHETDFRNDPEFPVISSAVLDMLGSSSPHPCVASPTSSPPVAGVIVGEATMKEDLKHWACQVDDATLPAGGAEFFEAVLEQSLGPQLARAKPAKPTDGRKSLFICGSVSVATRDFIARSRNAGVAVLPMPASDLTRWVTTIKTTLQRTERTIVSIEGPIVRDRQVAEKLGRALAEVLSDVINGEAPLHIYAEGGATASQIAANLGWKKFHVLRELAPGTVTMGIAGEPHTFTVKPGSYDWPNWLQPNTLRV